MLKFSNKLDINYEEMREKYVGEDCFCKTFSSQRKRMSTVIKDQDTGKSKLLLKGASEYVL